MKIDVSIAAYSVAPDGNWSGIVHSLALDDPRAQSFEVRYATAPDESIYVSPLAVSSRLIFSRLADAELVEQHLRAALPFVYERGVEAARLRMRLALGMDE